ncbi:MAG TPA: iron-containing alcohol dehydrogenase [Solirubrobacteraceae bacterium]|nr:iron-containing alcohol dehydrogenase [Solirubrobacteraceae bacterium]
MTDRAQFRWQDGERLLVFGRGAVDQAEQLLDEGYALVSTPRCLRSEPALAERAAAVHEVPAGRVDEIAGELRSQVRGEQLVALGGGRVIDVAKALAAADPPRRVMAIPTTLSGAEMTAVHRHAAGVALDAPRVRPAVVINDPALSASQPLAELAGSAANALGHAAEGPLTPLANPVARLAAVEAARQLARGLKSAEPDDAARDSLALGALLAGYAIGSTGYGLHHVLSQTLARFTAASHAQANAVMLPHSLRALAARSSGEFFGQLDEAVGGSVIGFAERLRDLTGTASLFDAGVTESELERCADAAAARPELHLTPPAADAIEIRVLYRAAQ